MRQKISGLLGSYHLQASEHDNKMLKIGTATRVQNLMASISLNLEAVLQQVNPSKPHCGKTESAAGPFSSVHGHEKEEGFLLL